MSTASSIRQPPSPPGKVFSIPDGNSARYFIRIPASACTLAGFRTWASSEAFPEHVCACFINQDLFIDMSPEELETHVRVKYEVARVLLNLERELTQGRFYGDGAWVTNEKAGLSTQPDGTFVTKEGLNAGRVRLVPREGEQGQYLEIEGTPDWVLEVVSNTSVQKDTQVLREQYHRAGIAEYWLVDARGEAISFQILYRGRTGYTAAPRRSGWQRSRVFGRGFRLDRERGDLGMWEYTLHVRPG